MTYEQNIVSLAEGGSFDGNLDDTDPVEPVGDLADVLLAPGGLGAVDRAPLAQLLTEIVPVPESPVEHFGQTGLQLRGQFRGVAPLGDGIGRFPVTMGAALDIFRAPGTPFNLEHPDPRIDNLVHEFDGTEVFRGHDVFVVHLQFKAGFEVRDLVAAAADLEAFAPVGRCPVSRQG